MNDPELEFQILALAAKNLTMKQAAQRLRMGYTTLWARCRDLGLGNPFQAAGKASTRAGRLVANKAKCLAALQERQNEKC